MIPQSGENLSMRTPKLSARRLSKAFGPVTVLQDVDVDFFAGEIHAVVGENGAGKSTLMRILSGILEPSAGEVWFDGRTVPTGDLRAMEKLGVRLIHQELNLAEDLSVVENLFLGQEPPVDIIYSPSMIAVAIELTAVHFVAKVPVNGNYILDSAMITPENATQYYFPSSPF